MTVQETQRVIRLSPQDNVAVAIGAIESGEKVSIEGQWMEAAERIPSGHKVAIIPIPAGQKVLKYGLPIGTATRDIAPGQHVHTHNLRSDRS